ncbi:MAG TPA: hypothetical protein VGE26_05325 [Sphingobacteriaceae bacterium]
MEEFLPLILGLIAVVYRIYTNFMKEQVKAKKRDTSKRPDTEISIPAESVPDREIPAKPVYIPSPASEEVVITPVLPYEPAYPYQNPEKHVRKRYEEPKYEPLKAELNVIKEGRSPEPVAEEVRRSRAIHAKHSHRIMSHDEEEDGRSAYADFDMHDAVIKSAILNRPEY